MLYLEDYLEMIEHLPQELTDRFTGMREMDLSVQNNMDSLEKRVRLFFSQCRRNELQGVSADNEYQSIRKEYLRVIEDADEKVHIANAMYDLVERYLHKLDEELHKFKCELEADNKGITEILEKRSIELDAASGSGAQKENRYFGAISTGSLSSNNKVDGRFKHKPEKRRDSTSLSYGPPEKRPALSSSLSTPTRTIPPALNSHPLISSTATPTLPYNLSHLGANNAIAAAASQAIVATTQMPQGRRTASLKASIEAINQSSLGSQELVIGRELAGATQNVIQAVERESLSSHRKKKKMPSMGLGGSLSGLNTMPSVAMSNPEPDIPAMVINENGMVVEQTPDGEFTYDPNEPRYCICNHVSYGDMVACDNETCPFEWFHYGCVGITSSPKGKWYCPQCTQTMRKRGGSRKN